MKIHIPKFFIFLFLAIFLSPTIGLSANSIDGQKAAHVKAAYIYHLVRLAQWPEQSLPGKSDPLKIFIVGSDPYDLVSLFRSSASELKAGVHPLAVTHLKNTSELMDLCNADSSGENPCHLVFFTDSEADSFKDSLDFAAGKNILTTSEIDHFPQDGGMVAFVVDGDRIRIKVNQEAVVQASLKISAEFLQHADIVVMRDPPKGEE